jgi:hypothetical protein
LTSAALILGYTAPAFADLIYTLDSPAGGPWGTVLLHQDGANVDVTVHPGTGLGFVGNGSGDALTFNLTGNPSITISFTTAGFSQDTSTPPIHADGTGNWEYGVICSTGCGPGGSAPFFGDLLFTVDNIAVGDFTFTGGLGPPPSGSHGLYFAADLSTVGLVSTSTPGVPVEQPAPEPGSLLLLAAGLMGLGGMRWKRGLRSLGKSA